LRATFNTTALGQRQIDVTATASNSTVPSVNFTLTGTGIGGNNTFTNGGGDGLWTNPNNWSLGHIPNAEDTAIIGDGFNVTLNTGAHSILALSMSGTSSLTITNGGASLAFSSPSTATTLSLGLGAPAGGMLTANGTLAISGALNLSTGGVLTGTGNVTIASPLNWSGGTMTGTGTFTNNGIANITGGTLDGKTFNNAGTANVSGFTMSNAATFNNQAGGTINAQADGAGFATGTGTPILSNQGTFTRSGGGGTYQITGLQLSNSGTVNANSGLLLITGGPAGQYTQTGGLTQLNGGNVQIGDALLLQGGVLGGTGTVTGGASNSGGTARPGLTPGILTVTPSYIQGAGGSLNIELGGLTAGTEYDQLSVTGAPGTAMLDGTLDVTLIDGFNPALGNSFTIVTSAGALSGAFSTENLPPLAVGLFWRVTYNANSVVLDVVAPNVTLAPDPLDFGNVKVGTASGAMPVTVTNSGTAAATLAAANAVTIAGANAADFAIAAGTTCANGTVLAAAPGPGNTCVINITFTPGALGARNATISVASNDADSPDTAALTGTGVLANVTVTPNPVTFGSVTLGATSAAMTATVTNTGTLAAMLAAANPVTITGANPGDFAIVAGTTTCVANFVLAANGGSCVVNITFTPSALGDRAATLNVFDDAPGSPQQTALTGTGVQSLVILDPSPVDFSNQKVGVTSAAMTVTVTNTGTQPAALDPADAVTIVGADAADFAIVAGTTTCVNGFPLVENGGSCIVDITFTPSATGARTANLRISNNDPNSPQLATLNGTGVQANVTVTPNPVAFATRIVNTTSAAMTVTVANTGTLAATLDAVTPLTITGANPGDFAIVGGTTTCVASFVLNPGGGSCVVNITFTPGASGARSATLNVFDDAPASPQQTALTGTGQTPPTADFSTLNIPFGNQRVGTVSPAQNVTITNNGEVPLEIVSLSLTGTDPSQFVLTNTGAGFCSPLPISVPGGGNCTFTVAFGPTSTGAKAANVTVSHNGNATGTPGEITNVALSGTGIQANVTLAPDPTNFGNQRVGTTSGAMTVTVTNSGTDIATLSGPGNPVSFGGANPGDFAVAGGTTCVANFVLAAGGGSCLINITFTPSATGLRAASVNVADDAPGSPQSAALNGTGIAPVAGVAPTPHDFGTRIINTTSAAQTFTVSNSGTDTLNIASIVLGGADAAHFIFANAGAGSCAAAGNVVPAGGNCTFTVAFSPTTSGGKVATVTVTDDSNGIPGSTQVVNLTGTGQTPPTADFSTLNIPFGNQRVGTVSPAQNVTITNNGEFPLEIVSLSLTGVDPSQFVLTNTGAGSCSPLPISVAGGGNCTFTVGFGPTSTGAKAANVTVSHNGNATGTAGTVTDVTLSGTGIQANVTLAPDPTNFGNQRVGTPSGAMTVTVTNSGTDMATLSGPGNPVSFGGANPGDFAIAGGTTCVANFVLAAGGGSCIINITFTPSATGARLATVNVADDAPGSPQSAALNGTGIQAVLMLAPDPNFGDQRVGTTSGAMTVTATNSGDDIATLSPNPVTVTGDFAFVAGPGTTCTGGTVLAAAPGPGNTCTIEITFTPTATGARAGTVSLADDAPGSPQSAALNGTGIAPLVSIAPTSPFDFGNQLINTTSAPQTFTVSNTGTDTLNITAIALGGAGAAHFVFANAGAGSCSPLPIAVAAGDNCTFTAAFGPTTTGAKTATVTVTDDDNAVPGSTQVVTLNGTGTAPLVSIAPASPFDFGNQNINTTGAAQTFTVSNTGTATLTVTNVALGGANSGEFVLTNAGAGSCSPLPRAVPVGGNCTFTAAFSPTTTGGKTATVTVTDDDNNVAGSTQVITLDGTGTQPGVSLSTTSAPDFGNVQVGTTVTGDPITLTNSGTGPLTINSIAIVGDNPTFSRTTNCPLSPATLAAGANCTITPSMSPEPGSTGPRAASISIVSDAPGSPHSIALSGTGVDFALMSTAPPPPVTAGGTVNVALSFDAIAGNTLNPTTFECTGLPPFSSCTFTPPSLPAGSTDTEVMVAIATTSRTAGSGVEAGRRLSPPSPALPLAWLALLAAMALFTLVYVVRLQEPIRARAGRLCMLTVLLLVGGYVAGCAGFPEGAQGTPAGNYTVTVTATSGTVQRSTTINLTVQ
jgi:hypothetical protein